MKVLKQINEIWTTGTGDISIADSDKETAILSPALYPQLHVPYLEVHPPGIDKTSDLSDLATDSITDVS